MASWWEEQKMEDLLDEVVKLNGLDWSDEDILTQVREWYGYDDDVTLTWETKQSVRSRAVVLVFPSAPKKDEVVYVRHSRVYDNARVEGVEGQEWLFAGPRTALGSRGQSSERWIDIWVPPE